MRRVLGLSLLTAAVASPAGAYSSQVQMFWTNSYTPDSQFADSLATGDVNGDGYADLAVGAPDVGSAPGKVYVFHGGPTGLKLQTVDDAATILTGPAAGSRFGASLAGAGDVNGDGYDDLLAGAYLDEGGRGAAYLFLGGPGGIPKQAAARFAGDQEGAYFGSALAGAGDVDGDGYDDVLIGAVRYDLPGKVDAGAAFLYPGGPQGIAGGGPATARVRFEGGQANAHLGIVAGAGDVNGDGYDDILVGSGGMVTALLFLGRPGGPPGGGPAAASTRLTWPQQPASGFGYTVAGVGDVNGDGYADVMVGARALNNYMGAAFAFYGGPLGIPDGGPSTAQMEFNPQIREEHLGSCLAGAGDVNGDGYADVLLCRRGLHLGGPSGLRTARSVSPGLFLRALAVGDINGDGFDDTVVGDPGYSVGRGAFNIAFGQGDGLGLWANNSSLWTAILKPGKTPAGSRSSVAGIGDVNGDGFGDFAIGASGYGPLAEGAAWIILGGPARRASSTANAADAAGIRLTGDQPGGRFGHDVAGAGDVDGDGYDDVLVSAPGYDDPEPDEGVAFLFRGGPQGVQARGPAGAAARIGSDSPGAGLSLVAGAGDVNGDGYADVLAGAPLHDGPEVDEGLVLLHLGSAAGLVPGPRFEADQAGALLAGVAGAGDVDGDGLSDILLGAQGYSRGQSREGAAFLFRGRPDLAGGSVTRADAVLEANQADAFLGGGEWRGTAAAGDVDADGYDDVLVSAPGLDVGGFQDTGRVLLFRGRPAGIPSSGSEGAAAVLDSNFAASWLGKNSLAGLGDMHADGYADVGMGTPLYISSSRLFLYPGLGKVSWPPTPGFPGETFSLVGIGTADSLAGAGDVDGDGYADVLGGLLNQDTGEWSAYLWYSNFRGGRPVQVRQLRGKGRALPVGHGGLSQAAGFRVEMTAFDTRSRGRAAKLEVEACPQGTRFGDAGCLRVRSAGWTGIPAGRDGVRLGLNIPAPAPAPSPGSVWRWRARLLYARAGVLRPGISPPPVPAHGPWHRLNAQSPGPDVRTGSPQQAFAQFVAPRGTAPAGAPASVEVVLTTSDGLPARNPVEVRWETRDGTAVNGRDYAAGSGTLVFPAGTASGTKQSFAVGILSEARPGAAFTLRLLGKDETVWSERREDIPPPLGGRG